MKKIKKKEVTSGVEEKNYPKDYKKVKDREVIEEILHCFVHMGESIKASFSPTVEAPNGYTYLNTVTRNCRAQLLMVFPLTFRNRPNIHIGLHISDQAQLTATPRNCQVGAKEMAHRRAKFTTRHSNFKNLELVMLERENELGTLKFLLLGGDLDSRPGKDFSALKDDQRLACIFDDWLDRGLHFNHFHEREGNHRRIN